MTELSCPKCGASRIANAVECPACGIIYAKYRAPRDLAAVAATATVPTPTQSPESGANPYAPPTSNIDPGSINPMSKDGQGVWRKGKVLVLNRGAELPDRCVRCNEPASEQLSRKLYWHTPWLYFGILLSLPVYLIMALVVRKKAVIDIPLCGKHASRRRMVIKGTWLFVGLSFALVCVAQLVGDPSGDIEGLLLVALGLGIIVVPLSIVFASAFTRPVIPRKIDDYYIWLGKCSKKYLEGLPVAPAGL